MRSWITVRGGLLVLLASVAAKGTLAQDGGESFDAKRFEAFRDRALTQEAERNWMKIRWQPDMDAARDKAQIQKRPILAVLVVGHRGERGAPEC